jgi:predicted dehydrogenase
VGVCDVEREKAHAVAERYGAERVYGSVEELVEDGEVEAVSIALPDHLHTDAAVSCALSGRHILVEKPFALSVEDCEAIVAAAKAGGAEVMVGFASRWFAPFAQAKDLIASGEASPPRLVRIQQNNTIHVPTEMLSWSSDSNILWWLGSHSIDLARWLMGDEVETVSSVAGWGKLRSMGVDTADFYVTTLRFEGGGVAVIENCWILPNSYPGLVQLRGQVIGETGMLTIDPISHGALEHVGRNGILRPGLFYDYELAGNLRGAFSESVAHFVDSVAAGCAPSVTAYDGTEVTRIILAALASAERGESVRIQRSKLRR